MVIYNFISVICCAYMYIQVDKESNNVRKVQRSNDELQEQVENLTLQLEHLQSRYVDNRLLFTITYMSSIMRNLSSLCLFDSNYCRFGNFSLDLYFANFFPNYSRFFLIHK